MPAVVETNTLLPMFSETGATSKFSTGTLAEPATRIAKGSPTLAPTTANPTGFSLSSDPVASALRAFALPPLLIKHTRSPACKGSCAVAGTSTTVGDPPPPPLPIDCHAAPSQMYQDCSATATRTSPTVLSASGNAAALATLGLTRHSPIQSPKIQRSPVGVAVFGMAGNPGRLFSCLWISSFQFCTLFPASQNTSTSTLTSCAVIPGTPTILSERYSPCAKSTETPN